MTLLIDIYFLLWEDDKYCAGIRPVSPIQATEFI